MVVGRSQQLLSADVLWQSWQDVSGDVDAVEAACVEGKLDFGRSVVALLEERPRVDRARRPIEGSQFRFRSRIEGARLDGFVVYQYGPSAGLRKQCVRRAPSGE
ncbi:hypothetical protein AB0C29_00495 [Actinoplanes sp. NPDC048791]|uniref:hypothetical protein n=1 Tax=Actinoplanes sp. NPDC048791 TaxID=3154623 RepID=UPI0033E05605